MNRNRTVIEKCVWAYSRRCKIIWECVYVTWKCFTFRWLIPTLYNTKHLQKQIDKRSKEKRDLVEWVPSMSSYCPHTFSMDKFKASETVYKPKCLSQPLMFYSVGVLIHLWPHHASWMSKFKLSQQQLAFKMYFVILQLISLLLMVKYNISTDSSIPLYSYSFCSCTSVPLLRPWQWLGIFNIITCQGTNHYCATYFELSPYCVHREHMWPNSWITPAETLQLSHSCEYYKTKMRLVLNSIAPQHRNPKPHPKSANFNRLLDLQRRSNVSSNWGRSGNNLVNNELLMRSSRLTMIPGLY